MITAVISDAANRATAIIGWPGKATNVDTITTGLIAGDDRRNARAAAGATPVPSEHPRPGPNHIHIPGRPRRRTRPHHGHGRTAGQRPLPEGHGTNAVIAADSTTPSTRKGRAWMTMARKIVVAALSAAASR